MEIFKKKCFVSAAAIDEISSIIANFCTRMRVSSNDTIRYRLFAEDCLIHWMEKGFDGKPVTLKAGWHLGTPYFILDIEGPEDDPVSINNEAFNHYCSSILSRLNLKPEYLYVRGHNRVLFRLKRVSKGQLSGLILVLAASLVIGFLGMKMPDSVRETLLNTIFTPVSDTFFDIISCVAGPLVFFSVAWSIYGIGDLDTVGRIGKRLIVRFLLTVVLAVCFASICFPLLVPGFSEGAVSNTNLSSVTAMILDIIPSNIVEPFASGNMLQILFLGSVIGIAMLYLGERTRGIASFIEQSNSIAAFLMETIGRLIPFVIFIVVISTIWSGSLPALFGIWKFLLIYTVVIIIVSLMFLLVTAWRHSVSPWLLVKKSLNVFMLALSTGSSTAAYNTSVLTCEKKFGIDSSLVSFGIPLGLIMHAPMTAIYYLLSSFYFAGRYGVACTPSWLLIAVFVSAVMAIAAPPVPSSGAVVYTVLFSQLGIPHEALALALTADVLTDFINAAFESCALQLTLVNVAAELGMIDLSVLRSAGRDIMQDRVKNVTH